MVKTTEFNVQTQMNYVVGNMSGFTAAYTGMDNLSALISSLMTSYTTLAGTGRAAYASMGAAVAAVGLKSAEAFGEFQRGMNIVKAIGNATNAQMQMLSQTANQFSSQFRMDISEINDGLTTLGRAGLTDVNNQIQVLQNGLQVAKLEGMDLAATLEDIVTTTSLLGGDVTSNNFGAQSTEVSNLLVATSLSGPLDVGDVIETLKFAGGSAAAAGANLNNEEGLKDLLGTIGAFSQKGVIGSIAGTALRAFITKPASQDATVKNALAELGLDAYSLWEKDEENGWQMKPIAEQIGLITDAMDKQHMTNLDRIEVWGDIVGNKMGQQMLKLDENKIKDVTNDIEHQRNLEEIYQGTLTNFASQVERLNQVFQSIYRNLGSGFATNLTSIVQGAADILEVINGFLNGEVFKIIATVVGPLGLAGLAKGLQDFGIVLGALKDNIKRSSKESIGSQELWVSQRGVIEKRIDKGENVAVNYDEWSGLLKQNQPKSSYRESEEEYKARMDKRDQDYQERQVERDAKKDEDYRKRQDKRDEVYRQQQQERTNLYKEQLTRLTQMSVGARFVQVEGSSIILDSSKLNIDFGESVTPMPNDIAEEIRQRENISQNSSQQQRVETLSGASVDALTIGANHIIPQHSKEGMDTSFSRVNRYAITLNEEGENTILNNVAYEQLRGIEKEYRAGVGIMMEAQRKGALFKFSQGDLNELHAAQDLDDFDGGRTFMTNEVREALIGMFKESGITKISGARIETFFNEQLKLMVDNFTERNLYGNIFEMDEEGNIGVQAGKELLLAQQMSDRTMRSIGQMYHSGMNLRKIYKDEFRASEYYNENSSSPYRKFDEFLKEKFAEYKNIDDEKISEWKNNGYRMSLLEFLNLGGLDMQGFNTYVSGLKSNPNISNQAIPAIVNGQIFSHLGFISQDVDLAKDILTLMEGGMDGTRGVVADSIKEEVEDAKKAISDFDPEAEITSQWVEPISIGVHKVVTHGLHRSSPGTAATAFIEEKNDIKNTLNDTQKIIEETLEQIENTTRLLVENINAGVGRSRGLLYAMSPREQQGLSILTNKLQSNSDMRDQFKTFNFKDLIEKWEEKKFITTAEKGSLKNISDRALKQLFDPDTGSGLLTALEEGMLKDIEIRRFQNDERIDSVYPFRLHGLPDPRLKNDKFVVLDTETNTTTDTSEKQMIQYAILDAENGQIQSNIINSQKRIQKHAEAISGISNDLKNTEGLDEKTFYDQLTRDLLRIIDDGKAIVAHNTQFDKSVILSNITRLASTGIYDDREYRIGSKTGNIYDAIAALDNAIWFDTLEEVKRYQYATDVYGNDIFVDRETGERTLRNIPVAEVLTGRKYDRSLAHRADFDVGATYDIVKMIGDSDEGRLLYDTVYVRFGEEYEKFMKNYKSFKDDFYKQVYEEFGYFESFPAFDAAEKLFNQLYAEEGLDKISINDDKYETVKKRFVQEYGEFRIREGLKLLGLYDTPMNSAFLIEDVEELILDSRPSLPTSKTSGSGKHYTPGDAAIIEDKAAITEKEIIESTSKNYVPYELKPNYIPKKQAKQLLEFFTMGEYEKITGSNKITREGLQAISDNFYLDGTEFQPIAHLIDALAYDDSFDLTTITDDLQDNQFGYVKRISEELLENPPQKAIMEAIVRKVGLSNIMIGNQSIESILNNRMSGRISQSDLISLLSSGKIIVDNQDSLGYRVHEDEEFIPTQSYEQLSKADQKLVDQVEEEAKKIVSKEFGPYDSLSPFSRTQYDKRVREEAIGIVSDEHFQDSMPKTQEGVDNASPTLKYNPRKGIFNDIVMTLMEKPVKDLIKMLDDSNIIEGNEDQIFFKGSNELATKIDEKLTIYESIFNERFKDGIFYYSSKVGGQEISNSSYKTFEDIPMIRNLMEMYQNLTGDPYTFLYETKSRKDAEKEMNRKFTRIVNGENALRTLNEMKEDGTINDPHNEEKVKELKKDITIGQKTQDALSKKKIKDSFQDDITKAPNFKDFSAVKKATQFLLKNEEQVRQLDSFFYNLLGTDGLTLSLGEQGININQIIKNMSKDALNSLLSQDKVLTNDDFEVIKQNFKKQLEELPKFVQEMIEEIINKAPSFYEAMMKLSSEGIKGFRIGADMHSPPVVITEFLQYISMLPDQVLMSSTEMQQAAQEFGLSFVNGIKQAELEFDIINSRISSGLFYSRDPDEWLEILSSQDPYQEHKRHLVGSFIFNDIGQEDYDRLRNGDMPQIPKGDVHTKIPYKPDLIQPYFDEITNEAFALSNSYRKGDLTQSKYLNQLYKVLNIQNERELMSSNDFKKSIEQLKRDKLKNRVTKDQARSRTQQIVAQYEDDNRIRGIRSRAVTDDSFREVAPKLHEQYKQGTLTMEEYIQKTMQLMGVEERRLMTEEDFTNKLIDLKRRLYDGDMTDVEAQQEFSSLQNRFEDDRKEAAYIKEKAKREAKTTQGGVKGVAYGAYYKLKDAPSKILGGVGKATNFLMGLTMNPMVMFGEMIWGGIQQVIELQKQAEEEKISKLSEISSNADSAFDEQQSKWEEAQAKDNEDFNDLSDNEKQDQMLEAIAQGREDFNNASGETKALIGKQNELISASNNLIEQKSKDVLTGYDGLQAKYTELMEGSGMYGTTDEFGLMDFLERIVNPDKLVDNSNTRRLDALTESSIQIDTRVKNMEEFTEDYQQVMASMGMAHRSLLDIYNVRGIMDESELKDTFFDQSPSNTMRIGSSSLMSAEKLAAIMQKQEKTLQRFENRYVRFTKVGTGKDRHIEATLGDGSIHKLATQLGLKDIEAAQVLAVHQLQRIQDVMINQVEPELAQQTLGIYNNTYQLGEANSKSDVQTIFQNTMTKGILAIQMQVAQLVYKAAMERALEDYQAETGDTETNTVGLLLNKARDTSAENHEIAKKYSARGWGSYLQSRDVNELVNQGYTEEQAIQKLAQEKGVSVNELTNAYAQSSYDELGKYGYNGTERWLKNNAGWIIPAAATAAGAIGGSLILPGMGTIGGAEAGGTLATAALAALGITEGVTIGAGTGAAIGGASSLAASVFGETAGSALAQSLSGGITNFSDPFSEYTNEIMRSYANTIPLDSTIEALNDAQVAADEEGNNGSDTDDSDANKQRYVQLAICNKKAIPKLNVNLFKKAPTFTVLNKNFKLRDIKINTADKAKNIENSLKNAIIDVQERSDPKIIQDSEAEYDPVGATDDATNLPTGASLTK